MASNESPYSVTYSLKDDQGFPILFTIRGDTFKDIMANMTEAKTVFLSEKYTANEKKGGYPVKEKEYVEGRICPKCNGRLVKITTAKGPAIKCENGKWNPLTKHNDGCDFFEWANPPQQMPSVTYPPF